MPVFLLQIVKPDGEVVRFPAGGALERDLIDACVAEVAGRYVGVLRTQKAVEQVVRESITAALMQLKLETVPLVTG